MEEWRDVVGYEGLYMVSNEGRVKSLDRYITRRGRKTRVYSRILRPAPNSCGYSQLVLYSDTKKACSIAALVAAAFLGSRPLGLDIDHIDRNKKNNRVENLRYVTTSQNVRNTQRCDVSISRFTGVMFDAGRKKPWYAQIGHNKKKKYLGSYADEKDAARAYNQYVIEHRLDRELNHA